MEVSKKVKRGDIFFVDLSEVLCNSGRRPVIVISNSVINTYSSHVIVVPLSSRANFPKIPTYVNIDKRAGLERESIAITESVMSIPKTSLLVKVGSLPEDTMQQINQALGICILPDKEIGKRIQIQSRMIIDEVIDKEEDNQYEFKEITGNPIKHVRKNIAEYACAFLNNKGGKILYGVDDDGVIKGVKLSRSQKNEIRTTINSEMHLIEPAIDPTRYDIEFHNVYSSDDDDNAISDLFVIEVFITPPIDSRTLYFTGNHHTYVKVPGGRKQLNGSEIQEWIRSRLLS